MKKLNYVEPEFKAIISKTEDVVSTSIANITEYDPFVTKKGVADHGVSSINDFFSL